MPQIVFRTNARRKVVRSSISIIVLGLVVVGAIFLYSAYKAYETRMDNQTYSILVANNYQMMAQGKFDQGATTWLNYAARTPNRAHKFQADLNAAALYVSAHENQKAVETVKKAEAVGGVTLPEAELAATAYQQAGDKATAIHYFQEAIRLTPHSAVDYSAEIAVLNRSIQELESSK